MDKPASTIVSNVLEWVWSSIGYSEHLSVELAAIAFCLTIIPCLLVREITALEREACRLEELQRIREAQLKQQSQLGMFDSIKSYFSGESFQPCVKMKLGENKISLNGFQNAWTMNFILAVALMVRLMKYILVNLPPGIDAWVTKWQVWLLFPLLLTAGSLSMALLKIVLEKSRNALAGKIKGDRKSSEARNSMRKAQGSKSLEAMGATLRKENATNMKAEEEIKPILYEANSSQSTGQQPNTKPNPPADRDTPEQQEEQTSWWGCVAIVATLAYTAAKVYVDSQQDNDQKERIDYSNPRNNHDDTKRRHSTRESADQEVDRMQRACVTGHTRLNVYKNATNDGYYVGKKKA